MNKSAVLSEDKLYRYRLGRSWAPEKGRVCWVMLNPSTADAEKDDATIRRCLGFTEQFGMGELVVVNLFAFRTTFPKELAGVADPVGPENEEFVLHELKSSDLVIVAWGVLKRPLPSQAETMIGKIQKGASRLWCLQKTKDGHPHHPVRIGMVKDLVAWP